MHDFLKSLTKLRIEDGVNDGIHKAINVAQPGGEDEGCYAGTTIFVEF